MGTLNRVSNQDLPPPSLSVLSQPESWAHTGTQTCNLHMGLNSLSMLQQHHQARYQLPFKKHFAISLPTTHETTLITNLQDMFSVLLFFFSFILYPDCFHEWSGDPIFYAGPLPTKKLVSNKLWEPRTWIHISVQHIKKTMMH